MTDFDDYALHELLGQMLVAYAENNKLVFTKYGLRRTRFYILKHLHDAPGMTLGELSSKTLIDLASASRSVRGMETAGLVRREENLDDRRLFTLYLTEAGEGLFAEVNQELAADIKERFASFDETTKESIMTINHKVYGALLSHFEARADRS